MLNSTHTGTYLWRRQVKSDALIKKTLGFTKQVTRFDEIDKEKVKRQQQHVVSLKSILSN